MLKLIIANNIYSSTMDVATLHFDSPRCPQPRLCRVPLMAHQLAMLLRCRHVELKNMAPPASVNARIPNRGHPAGLPKVAEHIKPATGGDARDGGPQLGFMMDPPGSGKTYVAICLATQDVEVSMLTTPTLAKSLRLPTLIVVPQHLLGQWSAAVEEAVGYPCANHAGDGAELPPQSRSIEWAVFGRYQDALCLYDKNARAQLSQYNIILTTSLLYETIVATSVEVGIRFHRVIFDEIDTIAANVKRQPPCDRIWFISATIQQMVSQEDGDSERTFRAFGGTLKVPEAHMHVDACLCNTGFIDESMRLPHPIVVDKVVYEPLIDDILAPLLNQVQLHAMNALDSVQVSGEVISQPQVLLTKVCHPIVDPSGNDMPPPAVLDPPLEIESPLQPQGITRWVRDQGGWALDYYLPLSLRTELWDTIYKDSSCEYPVEEYPAESANSSVSPVMSRLGSTATDDSQATAQPGDPDAKLRAMMHILSTECAGKKVLIVADNSRCLDRVHQYLGNAGVASRILDIGNIVSFSQAIRSYQEHGPRGVQVLLLNSALHSHGINLQVTHGIIMMHRLTDQKELQVVGRAQRPGRTTPLRVWRLLHRNESRSLHLGQQDFFPIEE